MEFNEKEMKLVRHLVAIARQDEGELLESENKDFDPVEWIEGLCDEYEIPEPDRTNLYLKLELM
tara:strand:- start:6110 stop:6301 length:192 start_codon:yes stop_codon:yes gene_type:complete